MSKEKSGSVKAPLATECPSMPERIPERRQSARALPSAARAPQHVPVADHRQRPGHQGSARPKRVQERRNINDDFISDLVVRRR